MGQVSRSRMAIPPAQDTPGVGDTPEAKKLQEGFRRRGEVDSGRPIVDAIREHGTTIHFGPLEPDTVAQFDHQANEITVNEGLRDASPNVLAAHLAHEGTHVQWVRDGKSYNTEDEIVNAEYAAFKNQANVWNTVKGAEMNEQCEDVAARAVEEDYHAFLPVFRDVVRTFDFRDRRPEAREFYPLITPAPAYAVREDEAEYDTPPEGQ